jgi:hypothetical protein
MVRFTRFLQVPHKLTRASDPASVHACGLRWHASHFGRAASSALRCARYAATLAFQQSTHSERLLPSAPVTHPLRPPLVSLAGLPHVAQSCRSMASTCSMLIRLIAILVLHHMHMGLVKGTRKLPLTCPDVLHWTGERYLLPRPRAGPVTQTEYVTRLIEYGYFDFFGLGTDIPAALDALDTAARIDHAEPAASP